MSGSPVPDQATPEGTDWDLWLGPAPLRAYLPIDREANDLLDRPAREKWTL
ncbi:MAG: hypothetical protein WD872_00260 [Pirellulaceae bacterium]